MLKLKVILSSTREGRQGENVAKWVMAQLKSFESFKVELLDLKEFQFPYYEDAAPSVMLQQPYTPQIRQKWAEKIAQADAILIVTPEYNHGYPAVLKSALDTIYHEWNKKPVAFVSYGASANGTRSVEQLRQVVIQLQMAPIAEEVNIGLFTGEKIFGEKGEMLIGSNNKKLASLVSQLHWWSQALSIARKASLASAS